MIEFAYLLYGVGVRAEAREARFDAKTATRETRSLRGQYEYLMDRYDRLALVSQAMWELLSDRLGVTEEMLADKVNEIDLRDGKLDGKLAPTISQCSDCGRKMSARHKRCFYCGGSALERKAFDGT